MSFPFLKSQVVPKQLTCPHEKSLIAVCRPFSFETLICPGPITANGQCTCCSGNRRAWRMTKECQARLVRYYQPLLNQVSKMLLRNLRESPLLHMHSVVGWALIDQCFLVGIVLVYQRYISSTAPRSYFEFLR